MTEKPDPARHVDAFQKLVDEWTAWEAYNTRRQGGGLVRGQFVVSQNPFAMELLRDTVKLLKAQAAVNTTLLAAIDDLNRRLNS